MAAHKLFDRVLGLALCIGLWWLGEAARRAFGIPLPGGVIGFALLLAMLALFRSAFRHVRPGAELLLGNLILFFIPPVMSIIAYPQFFGLLGAKLVAILLLGTALMMATIGLLAQWLIRLLHSDGGVGPA